MKAVKSILTMLVIFTLAAATSFAANTIVVRHGGTDTPAADLAAALAAAVKGDTIDITAYDTPIDGGDGFRLVGVNLVCSAPTQAVINFTGADGGKDVYAGGGICYMFACSGVQIRNIKFNGPTVRVAAPLCAFGTITIDRCAFNHFANGLWLLNTYQFNPDTMAFDDPNGIANGPLNATVSNTYVTDMVGKKDKDGNDTDSQAIQISSVATKDSGQAAPQVLINHCTMTAVGKGLVFDGTWIPDGNSSLSAVTVKNSLFYMPRAGDLVFAVQNDWSTSPLVGSFDLNKSYNSYRNEWDQLVVYNVHLIDTPTPDDPTHQDWYLGVRPDFQPNEINIAFNSGNTHMDPFVDMANGDYRLKATARENGNGEGDSNIGADQTDNGKIAGEVYSLRADGTGDFSDLKAALNAARTGDQIWITQGNNWALTDEIWDKKGITLKGALESGKPTLTSTQGSFFRAAQMTFDNLKFKGDTSKNQTGIMTNGPIAIRNCDFVDCLGAGIDLFVQSQEDLPSVKLGGDITSCTMTNSKIWAHTWSDGAHTPETFQMDSLVINHCTMVNKSMNNSVQANIELDGSFTTAFDGSQLTIKNSILKLADPNYRGCILAETATAQPLIHLSYNDYVTTDQTLSWNQGNGAEPQLGTTELKGVDPGFIDEAKGDYRILIASPVAAAGEGGSSMGASTALPTRPDAAKGWTMYN